MATEIEEYNASQTDEDRAICKLLKEEITANLAGSVSKKWHGAPVWFLNGNPIVGYTKRKAGVALLFWSGQSFDEPGLKPEGSFKAAEIVYSNADEVNTSDLKRWLNKAATIQWDYRNIIKNKGVLHRIA